MEHLDPVLCHIWGRSKKIPEVQNLSEDCHRPTIMIQFLRIVLSVFGVIKFPYNVLATWNIAETIEKDLYLWWARSEHTRVRGWKRPKLCTENKDNPVVRTGLRDQGD